MDFIVSKVAMAVTALIVLAILTNALDDSMFLDQDAEISRVLSDLCEVIERAHDTEAEVDLAWLVPAMPTGAELTIRVESQWIIGESGGRKGIAQPMCEYHTWEPSTCTLNRSTMTELDAATPTVKVSSGQALRISVVELLVDSSEMLVVFVSGDH